MIGAVRSNYLGGLSPVDSAGGGGVRELQRKLWAAAKRSPDRRFHAAINPILRGWGNYFRTGNAAQKFVQIDHYVEYRLWRLMRRRYGRNLKPGRWTLWSREWFEAHGLYRLRGTNRYPGLAS